MTGAVSDLADQIERDKNDWVVCNKLGSAFYFVDDRILYKEHHVVRNLENREIEDLNFFTRLGQSMAHNPYVQVHLGPYTEVNLLYCHRRILHLDQPDKRILLVGPTSLVQGSYRNYLVEPMPPLASGTIVKLSGSTFQLRVSSNHHCIFVRAKDFRSQCVRLFSDAHEMLQQNDMLQDESAQQEEEDDYELDPTYEPEENDAEEEQEAEDTEMDQQPEDQHEARPGRRGQQRSRSPSSSD